MNNSYQIIKNYIISLLLKENHPLEENTIQNIIFDTQTRMKLVGYEVFGLIISNEPNLTAIDQSDWDRIKKELETQFDVSTDIGDLIKNNNNDRDSTWWTSKGKQENEKYYWDRYKNYLSKSIPRAILDTLDTDTDVIMDNIENPEITSFERYGMVVGHVQSGKTGNYSALVCKAADAGYNFIVVIAGGINNLRDQTQQRLNEAFVGRSLDKEVGAGIGNNDRTKLPISLTTEKKDFNINDADRNSQGLNFDNINVPILLVIKKNTNSLKNVIRWLKGQYKNTIINHSMLIIDDESDYASINTNDENDPTKINKQIRFLIRLFRKSSYVAYTATPYANIFIDNAVNHLTLGQDLFPKDFIYALKSPPNYFGADKFFKKNKEGQFEKNVIDIDDYHSYIPPYHKNTLQILELPESLKDAIRHFLINIAIRHLRGQSDKHNSMLIHVSRFTNIHKQMNTLVTIYLEELHKNIELYGAMPEISNESKIIKAIFNTFKEHIILNEFTWEQILKKLTQIVNNVIIRGVHLNSPIPLVYRKDLATNAIVIGGASLSRGFTLEGLSVSYFLRNSIYYDTLMQMARWFGYRPGYEDLCKVYLPEAISNNFSLIIDSTNDLMEDFKKMSEKGMTPNDFGLAVKYNPDSALQITARNKLKNTKTFDLEMRLDGLTKETVRLYKNTENLTNINLIENLLNSIVQPSNISKVANNYLIRNVDKKQIYNFITNFKFFNFEDEYGLKSRMPIKFIKEYVNMISKDWDVSIHSGSGAELELMNKGIPINIRKQKRKLINKIEYFELPNRKVAAGNSEKIALSEQQIESLGENLTSKNIAQLLEKPLLMIHILQNDDDDNSVYPAFGICFPGGLNPSSNIIKLKINTVYLNNILNEDDDISLEENYNDL